MNLYIPGLNLPLSNQELWISIQSDGSLRYNSCGWHDSQQKAIAVQSHGRLVDADEFFKALTMDDRVSILEAMHVQSILSETPTIIPAEEGE